MSTVFAAAVAVAFAASCVVSLLTCGRMAREGVRRLEGKGGWRGQG